MRTTELEAADVLCDDEPAGRHERTARGSRFTYTPTFLEQCRHRSWGVGFQVPPQPVVETEGVNLHPFFARLLPDGARLPAPPAPLRRRLPVPRPLPGRRVPHLLQGRRRGRAPLRDHAAAPWLPRLAEIGYDARKTAHLERALRKRRAELGATR